MSFFFWLWIAYNEFIRQGGSLKVHVVVVVVIVDVDDDLDA